MIILATDSGLERTGYALFEKNGQGVRLGKFGCITTQRTQGLEERLRVIHDQFLAIIKGSQPDCLVIERLFFNTNQKTLIAIAQTQGVLLLLSAQYQIPVMFLTPLQIKQTLTGYGRSDKKNVQKMVQILLSLKVLPKPDDVVDAIACGLAYCALSRNTYNMQRVAL